MKYFKLFTKRIIYTLLLIFILIFIISTLYYKKIISKEVFNYLKLIILLFSIFINSYLLGKNKISKGYIKGLILGLLLSLLVIIISIINNKLNIRLLLFNSIILIDSVTGSIVGANKIEK